jgi:hypothetical protein
LNCFLESCNFFCPSIASNDVEIQEYLREWCITNDAEVVKDGKYLFRIRRKGQSNGQSITKETVDGTVYETKQDIYDKYFSSLTLTKTLSFSL